MNDFSAKNHAPQAPRNSDFSQKNHAPNGQLPGELLMWVLILSELAVFGDQPKTLPDGTVVYASDHNGIRAAFPILASYLP